MQHDAIKARRYGEAELVAIAEIFAAIVAVFATFAVLAWWFS
jgi:hypothetical protein